MQIAEKRREAKGEEEKERYTPLNPEFQRLAREIRKASSVISAKKIEENNTMGKSNAGEGAEKREPSYTVGGNAN